MNNHPDLYTMLRSIHDSIQRDLYRHIMMNRTSCGSLSKIKSKPNLNDVVWWNRPIFLYAIKMLKDEIDEYSYADDWCFMDTICRMIKLDKGKDMSLWGETLRHFGRNYTEELKILKWNNWPDNWPDLDDDEIRYVNANWNRIFSDNPYPSDFNNIKPKNPWLEKKTKRGK